MRVLITTSEYPPHAWGGLGRYSGEVVSALRKRADVDVICVPSYATPYAPGVRISHEMEPHGRTIFLEGIRPPGDSDSWQVGQAATSQLIDWLSPPYDVLFAQDFFLAPLVADLALAGIAKKVVCFSHLPLYAGFSYFDRPNSANHQHALEAKLFRLAQAIVVPSRFAQQVILQSYGLPPDRVIAIPEAVRRPSDSSCGLQADGGKTGPLHLLTISRLTRQKGVRYMVDLADALLARGLDFIYTIIGDGPMESFLQSRMEQAASGCCIKHIRRVEPLDGVFRHYRGSDLYVSLSVYETFGLVLAEAMACGCVPVAFDIGAVDEVVSADEGALVPVGDVGAMADSIMALAADPSRRAELSKRGLERATLMSWDTHAERLLSVFQDAHD